MKPLKQFTLKSVECIRSGLLKSGNIWSIACGSFLSTDGNHRQSGNLFNFGWHVICGLTCKYFEDSNLTVDYCNAFEDNSITASSIESGDQAASGGNLLLQNYTHHDVAAQAGS